MKKFMLLAFLMLGCLPVLQLSAQTRYLEPIFSPSDISVEKNVQYGVNATILFQSVTGEAVPQQLLMDVYRPASAVDSDTERPLVLFFHTGNFLPFNNPSNPAQLGFNGSCAGTTTDSVAVEICTRLARMGYVAASCDYRLGWLPTSQVPEIRRYTLINAAYRGVQDASTAIRYFRRSVDVEADKYGIDPDKIVLFGAGTGGYVSLNTALLDDYLKIPTATNGKFVWNPRAVTGNPCAPDAIIPMVIEQVNGNLTGTSVGQSPITDPMNNCAVLKIDTLCYPNWPSYSSDFNLAVNLGGALGDSSWIDNALTNPQPALISFQVPNDQNAPYTSGTLSVPGQDPPLLVVEVQGSYLVQGMMEAEGQQTAIVNANSNYLDLQAEQLQAYANSPAGLQDPRAGLYPFVMPPDTVNPMDPLSNAPWQWTSFPGLPPIPGVTSGFVCNTDKSTAIAYIDTIVRFYAPRACFALGLQGCVNQVLGKKEPIATDINVLAAPNPATDQVRFTSDEEIQSIQVIDRTGRQVRFENVIENNTFTLQRYGLQAGVYIVKLNFEKGFVTKVIHFN